MGSKAQLTLKKIGKEGFRYEGVAVDTLVIAGWTGRNQEHWKSTSASSRSWVSRARRRRRSSTAWLPRC